MLVLPVLMAALFASITTLATGTAFAYFALPLALVATVVLGAWVRSALD